MDHILSPALQAPDSPFLPNTRVQFAWDSVSLTSILACPRRYKYQILDGLVPNNPGFAIALVFGILFHKGLEEYHRYAASARKAIQQGEQSIAEHEVHDYALEHAVRATLDNPATATLPTEHLIDEMKENHDPDEDDGIQLRNSKIRTRYYLIRALVWYLDHYKDDSCETVILASGAPAVELSFRIPLPITILDTPLILCGHIDRVVSFNERLYVSDYKTSKSLTKQFFAMFDLSHQMTGYSVAGKTIMAQETRGIMIDGVALQVGGVKLGRHFTNRSDGQVAEYFELLRYVTQKAVMHYEQDSYPMNTASCYFCEFKDICAQPPEYRQRYIAQNYTSRPGWNPLENR
jgi:hypothetical protein